MMGGVEVPVGVPAIGTLFLAGILSALGWWAISSWTSPLNAYPGPFLARYTNWWRFAKVLGGRYYLDIHELHQKHGPIVRIGPNLLDIDIPEVIKTMYGSDTTWRKTEFFQNASVVIKGKIKYQLFSEIDPVNHARMKRPIGKYYNQGNVLSKETLLDGVISKMCQNMATSFDGKECDLGEWIAFCVWDMLGMIVFSQSFGYLDQGSDFDGTIGNIDKVADYFSAIGQIPILDYFLDKNPIVRLGPPHIGNVSGIAARHLADRLQSGNDGSSKQTEIPDFLQHFVDAMHANPSQVTENDVMVHVLTTLLAGADSSAVTIRAIFYYALKNPAVYERLEQEILAAEFGSEPAPYRAAKDLPYLDAIIREAMRMHPPVSMLLERYVPSPGLLLPGSDGIVIPAGTAVGVNPYVMGQNKRVFGPDAEEFRPERWLRGEGESEVEFRVRIRVYDAADLTFGAGARVCTGRYIALLEIYKVVATLVANFEIGLKDQEREWDVVGSWFLRQSGIVTRLRKRSRV